MRMTNIIRAEVTCQVNSFHQIFVTWQGIHPMRLRSVQTKMSNTGSFVGFLRLEQLWAHYIIYYKQVQFE